jgi:hypothetical protein
MAATWKETHRYTTFGRNLANQRRSQSVISGLVYGLTDARDQLSVAEAYVLGLYSGGHPDSGLPIGETSATWERGDTGDGQGAIARINMTFGFGVNGGITGGALTVDGVVKSIWAGSYFVELEGTEMFKGPGDVDQQMTYGIGRVAGATLIVKENVVPTIPVGGRGPSNSTMNAFFGINGTAPSTGTINVVVEKSETIGVGWREYTVSVRKPTF